jgi:hypothetical protein
LDLVDEAMGKGTIEARGIVMIVRVASVRVTPERIEGHMVAGPTGYYEEYRTGGRAMT